MSRKHILVIAVFLPMVLGAHCTGALIKGAVFDCTLSSVKQDIPHFLPLVADILNKRPVNWQEQLDQLAGMGADALACAVQQIAAGMIMTPKAAPGERPLYTITPNTMSGAHAWLKSRDIKFTSPTPAPSRGSDATSYPEGR